MAELTWAIMAWRSLAVVTIWETSRFRESSRRSASTPSWGRIPSLSPPASGAAGTGSGASAPSAPIAGASATRLKLPADWPTRFIVK